MRTHTHTCTYLISRKGFVRSYRSVISGDPRTGDSEDESDGVLPSNSLKRSIWADNLSNGGLYIRLVVEQYSEVEGC